MIVSKVGNDNDDIPKACNLRIDIERFFYHIIRANRCRKE